jgi:hypothetical protein
MEIGPLTEIEVREFRRLQRFDWKEAIRCEKNGTLVNARECGEYTVLIAG